MNIPVPKGYHWIVAGIGKNEFYMSAPEVPPLLSGDELHVVAQYAAARVNDLGTLSLTSAQDFTDQMLADILDELEGEWMRIRGKPVETPVAEEPDPYVPKVVESYIDVNGTLHTDRKAAVRANMMLVVRNAGYTDNSAHFVVMAVLEDRELVEELCLVANRMGLK